VVHPGPEELKILGVDKAPDFTLSDAIGNQVVPAELLGEGPVVVTFYRGE
jgi:peroxiredoxin